MELETITIEKFKNISQLTLNLASINYLVGGNNAGKSSTLQAIHTAVTMAQTATEFQRIIISDNLIKYSPTGNFEDIGHGGPLENVLTGKRANVKFYGKSDDDQSASYEIALYKGRNFGAGVDRSGTSAGFGTHITKTNPPFSIYVPGLAGIPHFEEFRSTAIVIRKIAGGEANSVLRNVLLMIQKKDQLNTLKERMQEIFSEFDIDIKFNADKDQTILVQTSTKNGYLQPLDLMGTGVLQALQLFAYAILFEPVLLLLDEPDSHLHPSNQQQLVKTLESITKYSNIKIILSTHSRHMINNLPDDAKLFWLENGILKQNENLDTVQLLSDLGALDQSDEFQKDLLILTEDSEKKLLNKLLEQINAPLEKIGIVSYNGVANFQIAIRLAKELLRDNQKIIVHRDRDFLTPDEVNNWENIVINLGAIPYITEGSDLEMAFTNSKHLASVSGKDIAEIDEFIDGLINEFESDLRLKFRTKRQDHIKKLYRDGGSPETDTLCPPGLPLGKP